MSNIKALIELQEEKPKPKYRAQKVLDADGKQLAASKGEYRRRRDLEILQQAGHIKNLSYQPKFEFVVNGVRVGTWTADFMYEEGGKVIVEDFKGYEPPVFKFQKRLFMALYPEYQLRITKR